MCWRPILAALELQHAATICLLEPVLIGRACGIMHTGVYGEATCRSSSMLDDALNLNAFVPPRPTRAKLIVATRT